MANREGVNKRYTNWCLYFIPSHSLTHITSKSAIKWPGQRTFQPNENQTVLPFSLGCCCSVHLSIPSQHQYFEFYDPYEAYWKPYHIISMHLLQKQAENVAALCEKYDKKIFSSSWLTLRIALFIIDYKVGCALKSRILKSVFALRCDLLQTFFLNLLFVCLCAPFFFFYVLLFSCFWARMHISRSSHISFWYI